MTARDFTAFYPQFTGFTPAVVLTEYISQSNLRFTDWEEDAEEARRIYTAQKLTQHARTAPPEGSTSSLATLAAAGTPEQKISSKKVGEVAVSYSTATSPSSSSLSDLSETTFGQQLLTLIRLHSMTTYVP